MKVKAKLNHVDEDFLRDYLVACGVSEVSVDKYIHLTEPFDRCFEPARVYPNVDGACAVIKTVVEKGEKVAICVDSDLDGMASSAIMYRFLKEYLLIPSEKIIPIFHTGKQHSICSTPEDNILQQVIDSGASLLIVPDAGLAKRDVYFELAQHNIQVIHADHHECKSDVDYAIVVNHHLAYCGDWETTLNTALSGTGVTYKLIERYAELYLTDEELHLIETEFTPYVAISLISDVCDMTNIENRAFYLLGVSNLIFNKELNELVTTLNYKGETDPHGFSFGCIPPINALCRSNDQEGKEIFFQSLVGERPMEEGIAVLRKVVNEQRKTVDELLDFVCTNLVDEHKIAYSIVDNKYAPYTGLVANKGVTALNKPVFILREVSSTQYSGSLRSPFPISNVINESRLAKAEGHLQAAGILIPKANLKKLLKYLDEHLTNDVICDTIEVTAKINPADITTKLCTMCEEHKDMWGSSGSGIVEPTFYIKATLSQNNVAIFRKKTNTGRINIGGANFIKFRLSDEEAREWECYDYFTFEAIVTLCVNEWNGNTYPQGMIQEWEITPTYKRRRARSLADDDDWSDLF